MPEIAVIHKGRFFFVQADGVTLGHAYKIPRLFFRSRWGASASVAGQFVDLGVARGEFNNKDEAVQAILAHHDIDPSN